MINFIISIVIILTVLLIIGVVYLIQGPPFVMTDNKTAQEMVTLLVKYKAKQVIDIGSGDGKLVIAFAKAGFHAYGIEMNPLLVLRSRRTIKKLHLENKARIIWGNFWKADFSAYDILVIYGIKHIMRRLGEKLETSTKPETKIITNFFLFPQWKTIEKKNRLLVYRIKH